MTDKQPDTLRAALAAPQPGYVLVPVEPEQKYLRPFHSCPPDELGLAWQAMVTVARVAAPKAPQQAASAVTDDLRDRLVAISEAIADQDDRGAQAMLREILAAKPAPQQEVQEPSNNCAKADSTLVEVVEYFLESQAALDNREGMGINAEPYEVFMRRRNAAWDALEAAISKARHNTPEGGKATETQSAREQGGV